MYRDRSYNRNSSETRNQVITSIQSFTYSLSLDRFDIWFVHSVNDPRRVGRILPSMASLGAARRVLSRIDQSPLQQVLLLGSVEH